MRIVIGMDVIGTNITGNTARRLISWLFKVVVEARVGGGIALAIALGKAFDADAGFHHL